MVKRYQWKIISHTLSSQLLWVLGAMSLIIGSAMMLITWGGDMILPGQTVQAQGMSPEHPYYSGQKLFLEHVPVTKRWEWDIEEYLFDNNTPPALLEIVNVQWRWAPESPAQPPVQVIPPTTQDKRLRIQMVPVTPYAVLLVNFIVRDQDNNLTPVRFRIIMYANPLDLPENDCDCDGIKNDDDGDCECCGWGNPGEEPGEDPGEESGEEPGGGGSGGGDNGGGGSGGGDNGGGGSGGGDNGGGGSGGGDNGGGGSGGGDNGGGDNGGGGSGGGDNGGGGGGGGDNGGGGGGNGPSSDTSEGMGEGGEKPTPPTPPTPESTPDKGAVQKCSRWSFRCTFGEPMKATNATRNESVFDLGIMNNKTLGKNLREIFYPSTQDAPNRLWYVLRVIMIGFFVLLFIWAGARFFIYADNEAELSKSKINMIYIIAGAGVMFMTIWILGVGLNITEIQGLASSEAATPTLLSNTENNIMRLLVGFLKGAAFFVAIVLLFWNGYGMMTALDSDEKLKKARSGVINVVLALIFIKIIDYLYIIAQAKEFKNKAIELLVEVSKVLGYVLGLLLVIAALYAGYVMITASGDEARVKQATNILKALFVVTLVIFLFMLVVYQIFGDILG